ncbi:MAG: hypothetical protein J1E85_01635 [Ruminococcus sp.]|nr:hypothetical protein [Ruminococcus sp.]
MGGSFENKLSSADEYSAHVFALGITMDLMVYVNENVLNKAETLISELENKFSTTDVESNIYNINHNEGGSISSDTLEL